MNSFPQFKFPFSDPPLAPEMQDTHEGVPTQPPRWSPIDGKWRETGKIRFCWSQQSRSLIQFPELSYSRRSCPRSSRRRLLSLRQTSRSRSWSIKKSWRRQINGSMKKWRVPKRRSSITYWTWRVSSVRFAKSPVWCTARELSPAIAGLSKRHSYLITIVSYRKFPFRFAFKQGLEKLHGNIQFLVAKHEKNCNTRLHFFVEPSQEMEVGASGFSSLNAYCATCEFFSVLISWDKTLCKLSF